MIAFALRARLLLVVAASAAACGGDDTSTAGATGGGAGMSGQGGAAAGTGGAGAGGAAAGTGGAGAGGAAAGTGGAGAGGFGGSGAGTGGAATGGGGSGTAGFGVGGSGGSLCSYTSMQTICFDPTGKSLEPLTNNPFEGEWYLACAAMARDASADCPPPSAVCGGSHCSVKDVTATGGPTKVGNDCCYDTAVCLGASGCGRPLVVSGFSRVARLARGAAWAA